MKELKMDIVLGVAEQLVSRNFMSETDVAYAFNTFQYNDKDIYTDEFRSMAEVKRSIGTNGLAKTYRRRLMPEQEWLIKLKLCKDGMCMNRNAGNSGVN